MTAEQPDAGTIVGPAAFVVDAVGPLDPGQFSDPPRASRPAVLWFLNGHLTEQLVTEQLAEMRSVGIYEAVLFPYQGGGGFPSTTPPYLSEGWFGIVGHALREAQRSGMHLWIFDDEFFPSGRAGGLVIRAADDDGVDLRPRALVRLTRDVCGPATVDLLELPRYAPAEGLSSGDGILRVAANGLCLLNEQPTADGQAISFSVRPSPVEEGNAAAGWVVRACHGHDGGHAWSLREGVPGVMAHLFIRRGITESVRETSLPFHVTPGDTYRVRVVAASGRLRVYVDDALVDEIVNECTVGGTVGFFREYPTQVFDVADLRIDSLDGESLYRQTFAHADAVYDFARDASPTDVVAVVAVRTEGGASSGIVDLTEEFHGGRAWSAPPGQWQIQYFLSQVAGCIEPYRPYMRAFEVTDYVDPLNAAAVDQLIDTGYEEYHRRFPWAFGGVLRGFWNDEPIFAVRWPESSRAMVWSDEVREAIEKLGGTVAESLPALFEVLGEGGARGRARYWRAVSTLLAENYYRKLGEWAERRGVAMASNPMGDGCGPATCLSLGGDLLKNNQWFQVPGCDTVHPRIPGALRAQAIITRHASSPAHQAGRRRVLVENMGAYGPAVAPHDVRFVNGAFAMRGANLSVFHAFHLDRDPGRYRHKPPLDPSSTWWAHMAELVNWIGRVMEANQGRTGLQTAVVSPQRAAEAAQPRDWHTSMREYEDFARGEAYVSPLDKGVYDTVVALEDGQVDLDLLDEGILDGDPSMAAPVRAEDGLLRVGEQSYRLVVLPPTPRVSLRTIQTLTHFVRLGGVVAVVGDLPSTEADSDDAGLDLAFRALFDGSGAGRAVRIGSAQELRALASDTCVNAVALDPPTPQVRALRRVRDDQRIYLLFNEGDTRVDMAITFRETTVPEIWDPSNGSRRMVSSTDVLDDSTRFCMSLEPSELTIVVFSASGNA